MTASIDPRERNGCRQGISGMAFIGAGKVQTWPGKGHKEGPMRRKIRQLLRLTIRLALAGFLMVVAANGALRMIEVLVAKTTAEMVAVLIASGSAPVVGKDKSAWGAAGRTHGVAANLEQR